MTGRDVGGFSDGAALRRDDDLLDLLGARLAPHLDRPVVDEDPASALWTTTAGSKLPAAAPPESPASGQSPVDQAAVLLRALVEDVDQGWVHEPAPRDVAPRADEVTRLRTSDRRGDRPPDWRRDQLLDWPRDRPRDWPRDRPRDRPRGTVARGTALAAVVAAALSVSGVAAAVTGDPLAPYRAVLSLGGDDDRPRPARGAARDDRAGHGRDTPGSGLHTSGGLPSGASERSLDRAAGAEAGPDEAARREKTAKPGTPGTRGTAKSGTAKSGKAGTAEPGKAGKAKRATSKPAGSRSDDAKTDQAQNDTGKPGKAAKVAEVAEDGEAVAPEKGKTSGTQGNGRDT